MESLKNGLSEEGSQLSTNCGQLKMEAADGKMRLTDVADTNGILRIIQSIPSKKAEPFKLWLAQVGEERIDETRQTGIGRTNWRISCLIRKLQKWKVIEIKIGHI